MAIKLRGKNFTNDLRLDRIKQFDERSRNYPIRKVTGTKPYRSYTWRCSRWLDQGSDGACVGFSIAHELIARPAEVKGIMPRFAKEKIYWEAQKIDEWRGGSYPGAKPFYEGTSVLAGAKVVQSLGYIDSYYWSFSISDFKIGIGYHGPAVIGINWYEDMMETDSKGFIKPTGSILGGHAILVRSINIKDSYFLLRNSWGSEWGKKGDCKLSFKDMGKLLKEDGEAVFFKNRHSVPK